MSSKMLTTLFSIPLTSETKDILGPSSLMMAERVFAFSVMPKIAPTSSIPCELATDPVGFKERVGMTRAGPVVMELGSAPGANDADWDGLTAEPSERGLEDTLWEVFETPATGYIPELLLV